MTLQEAQRIIRDDQTAWVSWVEASGVLAQSRESTFEDLLECMKRRGLPAETAVCALYVRTKRPRADDTLQSVVMDLQDWSQYLQANGFIHRHAL